MLLARASHTGTSPLRGTRWLERLAWTPLLGFSKDRPSVDISIEHPLPVTVRACQPRGTRWPGGSTRPEGQERTRRLLRPGVASLRARSALAVPPGSDGLLCSIPCRFVAPCSRPWGSPRFRGAPGSPPAACATKNLPKEALTAKDQRANRQAPPFPWRFHPSELSPRRELCRVTAADALSPSSEARCRRPTFPEEGRAAVRGDATDLKALFHRRVRCDSPAFQPARRPMLPWASDPREDRRLRLRGLGAASAW